MQSLKMHKILNNTKGGDVHTQNKKKITPPKWRKNISYSFARKKNYFFKDFLVLAQLVESLTFDSDGRDVFCATHELLPWCARNYLMYNSIQSHFMTRKEL